MPQEKEVREMERSLRAPGMYGVLAAVRGSWLAFSSGDVAGATAGLSTAASLRAASGRDDRSCEEGDTMLPRRKLRTSLRAESGRMRRVSDSMRLRRGSWKAESLK